MEKQDYKIYIIGAGIKSLVEALDFEKAWLFATIIESPDLVGGGLKTNLVDDYQ